MQPIKRLDLTANNPSVTRTPRCFFRILLDPSGFTLESSELLLGLWSPTGLSEKVQKGLEASEFPNQIRRKTIHLIFDIHHIERLIDDYILRFAQYQNLIHAHVN